MSKLKKAGVVILNYINYKDTIECVRSFLRQKDVNLEIVIIDNGSPNESYKILTEYFKGYKNINIIKNMENKGYSKGNNVGIQFLQKLNLNFIIIANSDTKLLSNNTIFFLISAYKPNIAVISPNIKNMDGSNDLYVVYKKRFLKLRLIKACLQAIFWRKPLLVNTSVVKNKNIPKIDNNVIGLTGSFYMLTPSFFKYYRGLFNKTFLYGEENATIECLRKKNLDSLKYSNDETLVVHKGAASSSEVLRVSNRKKKLMAKSAIKVLGFIIFG